VTGFLLNLTGNDGTSLNKVLQPRSGGLQRQDEHPVYPGCPLRDGKGPPQDEGNHNFGSCPLGPLGFNFSQHGPTTRPCPELLREPTR